jgi:hypothetical protein
MRIVVYAPDFEEAVSPPPLTADDGSGDWWSGVARNFASVAIATAVASSALAAQLPFGLPTGSGWHQDEVPTTSPGVLEDSTWNKPVVWDLTLPVKAFSVEDDLPITASAVFDEDVWQIIVPRTSLPSVNAFQADDDLPPGAHDEDGWIPKTPGDSRSVTAFIDRDDIPSGLFGQYDEDFWSNPTAPIPATLSRLDQFRFEQNEQATGLYGVPEESDWPLQLTSPVAKIVQPFIADDDLPSIAHDEDGWIPPQSVPSKYVAPFSVDDEIIPTLTVVDDSDGWRIPVPVTPSRLAPVFVDDDVPVLRGLPNDELWINPAPSQQPSRVQVFQSDDDLPIATVVSEDEWNVTLPRAQSLPVQVFRDFDEIPAGNLRGLPDDSEWKAPSVQNSTSIVRATSVDDEIVPQSIVDEDAWFPRAQGSTASVNPFGAEDELPPHAFEEDAWTARIQQGSSLVKPFTSDDDLAYFSIDEGEWTAPRQDSARSVRPFACDDDYAFQPTGPLFTDDDVWVPSAGIQKPQANFVAYGAPAFELQTHPSDAPIIKIRDISRNRYNITDSGIQRYRMSDEARVAYGITESPVDRYSLTSFPKNSCGAPAETQIAYDSASQHPDEWFFENYDYPDTASWLAAWNANPNRFADYESHPEMAEIDSTVMFGGHNTLKLNRTGGNRPLLWILKDAPTTDLWIRYGVKSAPTETHGIGGMPVSDNPNDFVFSDELDYVNGISQWVNAVFPPTTIASAAPVDVIGINQIVVQHFTVNPTNVAVDSWINGIAGTSYTVDVVVAGLSLLTYDMGGAEPGYSNYLFIASIDGAGRSTPPYTGLG